MKKINGFVLSIMICLIMVTSLAAQGNLTDPFEILNKYYEATGGLDKLRSVKTTYAEGILKVAGLEGTFKHWTQVPMKNRTEVDLSIVKQVSGDNGNFSWGVDANGKLQIAKDDDTMKRRKLQGLMEDFAFLDPESNIFTVTFDGIEPVDGTDCYVIKIANNINADTTINYIATDNFYLLQSTEQQPDGSSVTRHKNFKEVSGLIFPSLEEVTILPIGQEQTIEISKIEVGGQFDQSLFEPPGQDARDFRFTEGNSAENIPFKYIENHLYIPVNLSGQVKLWCLDTGAGASVIDSAYAIELGLKLEGDLKGQGAGAQVQVSFTTLPEYSLKGLEFDSQVVAVINVRKFFKRWGMDVDGILGYDFLSRFVVKVDYAKELISFYDPDSFEYTGDGVVLDAPIKHNTFSVMATVNDEYSGRWSTDLGAGSMNFHFPYAEEHQFKKMRGVERLGVGAGGAFKEKSVQFDKIEFAGFTIDKPLIDITYENEGAFGKSEEIGNLGNTLFRHFVLYLDYKNQRVIVEKGDNFDKIFPRDKSGLQLEVSDADDIRVFYVSENTPADKAGLKKGDIFKSINDLDVAVFDGVIAIRELFQKDEGTTYKIGITRDGKPKELKLTLKNLY